MAKTSAGLLMFRTRGSISEVLLVHYGGPFWKDKDDGAWTIPKCEIEAGEALLGCTIAARIIVLNSR